jgi:hypothetical protein
MPTPICGIHVFAEVLCAPLASKARARTVIPAADTAASSPVTIDFSVRVGRWQRPELDPASGPAALAIRLGVDHPLRPDLRARS